MRGGTTREAYLRRLAEVVGESEVIVSSLGACTRYLTRIRDREGTFYLVDTMGGTIPVALGLALGWPGRRVIALEGDGALLMAGGVLASVASHPDLPLTVVVFQNDVYESSGGQPLPRATVDYAGLARASGIGAVTRAADPDGFGAALRAAAGRSSPSFITLDTAFDPGEQIPPYTVRPLGIRERFLAWVRRERSSRQETHRR